MSTGQTTKNRNKGVRPQSSPTTVKSTSPDDLLTAKEKEQVKQARARDYLLATTTPEARVGMPFCSGLFRAIWTSSGGASGCCKAGYPTGSSARGAGQLPI
jgi:hypothetical protein